MRHKVQKIGNDLATANKLEVSLAERADKDALQKANLEQQMLSVPHLMTVADRKKGIEKALLDNEEMVKDCKEKINNLNEIVNDRKVAFENAEKEVNESYSKRLKKLDENLKKHAECRKNKGKKDDCMCKDCHEWIQQRNDITDIINSKLALEKFKLTVSEQGLENEKAKLNTLTSTGDHLKDLNKDITDNQGIYRATECMEALLQESDAKDERHKQLVREHYNKYQVETQFHHQAIHGFTKNVGALSSQLTRFGAPPELYQACIAMQHAADIYSALHLLNYSSAPYLLKDICKLDHIQKFSEVKFSDIGNICTKIIENSDKLSLDAVLSFFINPSLGAIIGALGMGMCLLNIVYPIEDPVMGAIRNMTTLIIEHIKQLSSTLMAIDKKHSNMLEVIHNQCDKIISVLKDVNQNISYLNKKIDIYHDERKEHDNKSNYIEYMSAEHELLEKINKKMDTIKYLRDKKSYVKLFENFNELLTQISSKKLYIKLSILHPGYLNISVDTGLINKPENFINLLAKWPYLQNILNPSVSMPHFDLYMNLVDNFIKNLQCISENNAKLDSNDELFLCLKDYISKANSIDKFIESLRDNTSWLDNVIKDNISINKELLTLLEEAIMATNIHYKFALPTSLQSDYRDSNIINNVFEYIQMVKEKKLNELNEFSKKTDGGSHRLIKIYVSTYASLLLKSLDVSIDKSIRDKTLNRFIKLHCFPLDYFPEFIVIPSVYNDHLPLLLPKSIFSGIESELIKLLTS